MSEDKRWIYLSRLDKWYLVDTSNPSYIWGVSQSEFEKYGEEISKELYLSPALVIDKAIMQPFI